MYFLYKCDHEIQWKTTLKNKKTTTTKTRYYDIFLLVMLLCS